ncbi:hypothetical protein HDU76_009209 [Blyttiomyces sp. JEL0837]|nr:hypothetical protein HDU76_009209 [Blyttiomyces sp. JEL0837]
MLAAAVVGHADDMEMAADGYERVAVVVLVVVVMFADSDIGIAAKHLAALGGAHIEVYLSQLYLHTSHFHYEAHLWDVLESVETRADDVVYVLGDYSSHSRYDMYIAADEPDCLMTFAGDGSTLLVLVVDGDDKRVWMEGMDIGVDASFQDNAAVGPVVAATY